MQNKNTYLSPLTLNIQHPLVEREILTGRFVGCSWSQPSLITQLWKNDYSSLSMDAVFFSLFGVPTRWFFSIVSAHFRYRVPAYNAHKINHIKLTTAASSGLKFHHDNSESRYAHHNHPRSLRRDASRAVCLSLYR